MLHIKSRSLNGNFLVFAKDVKSGYQLKYYSHKHGRTYSSKQRSDSDVVTSASPTAMTTGYLGDTTSLIIAQCLMRGTSPSNRLANTMPSWDRTLVTPCQEYASGLTDLVL